MSVAFFGMLIWLSAHFIRNKWLQALAIFLLATVVLMISFSRIYLRVHYATDIIAGMALGFSWLLFCLYVVEILEIRYYKKRVPGTDPAKLPQGL
jgi:undecaprenyl-diphosphatase